MLFFSQPKVHLHPVVKIKVPVGKGLRGKARGGGGVSSGKGRANSLDRKRLFILQLHGPPTQARFMELV